MSEARIDRISNENNTGGPTLSGITTFSGQNYFVPPRGTTAERPSDCPPGSIRFNTDSAKLEYFDSLQWLELEAFNVELGGGTGSNTGLGYRGLFGGGYVSPSAGNFTNVIDYVTISTLGNAIDFGDLTLARRGVNACSSSTRGVFAGGYRDGGGYQTRIDFITISSTGDATNFGNLSVSKYLSSSCSSSTRGVFGGAEDGTPSLSNAIDYVTIASAGNAQDFGDMYTGGTRNYGSCSSSVRAVFAGGDTGGSSINIIQYITISTLGNSIDFGDLISATSTRSCSNATRGLFLSGSSISFISIASLGNAQGFGDVTVSRGTGSACASPVRGLFGGGGTGSNVIDYVTISTTGNASDFGDLSLGRTQLGACSNAHGGL